MRIGIGYDVHKLVEDRRLILGGVDIPYQKGLLGHSDADVLIHAIVDALLGASGMGDIGIHFPDNNESYRGISSLKFLETVEQKLAEKGFSVNNIDATVIAQAPKISGHIPKMVSNIAKILKIEIGQVNVKATTTEGLGFEGAGKGIAAYAAVTVKEKEGEQ